MEEKPKTCMTDGSPVTDEHKEIDPATGQQKGYVVLCPEERAKGFVRPLRSSYKHVGIRPQYPLRKLTQEERTGCKGFIAFEQYPEGSDIIGRYWTDEMLNSGCGGVTTMSPPLAETYARNPKFYGATFCVHCKKHFPVAEFVWEPDGAVVGS